MFNKLSSKFKFKNLIIVALAIVMSVSLALSVAFAENKKVAHADVTTVSFSAAATNSKFKHAGSGVYYTRFGSNLGYNASYGIQISGNTGIAFKIDSNDTAVSVVTVSNGNDRSLAYVLYTIDEDKYNSIVSSATNNTSTASSIITGGTQTLTGNLSFTSTATSRSLGELDEGYYGFFISSGNSNAFIKSITFTTAALEGYNVKYNLNGGTLDSSTDDKTVTSDTASYTVNKTPTKQGYTFLGWSLDNDTDVTDSGDIPASQVGTATITITDGTVFNLYAAWKGHSFTIAYDNNGGSGSMSSQNVTFGDSSTVKTNGFSHADASYGFDSWNTKADGTGVKVSAGADVDTVYAGENETVTLYAQWKELGKFNVTFHNTYSGSDVVYKTIPVTQNATMTESQWNELGTPESPNGNILRFGGWWTEDGYDDDNWPTTASSSDHYRGLSGFGYLFDVSQAITANTDVYALWIDPVDTESFQDYIDNMIQSGINNPYADPLPWGSEGFKGKWNYIDGVFLNSVVNLYYNTDESETITYKNWSGSTVTTSKKEYYKHFFTNFVSDYVNNDGNFTNVAKNSGSVSGTTSSKTLDFIAESRILFDAYELTGDEKYLKAIEKAKSLLNSISTISGSEITIGGKTYKNYAHQDTSVNKGEYSNEIWLDGMYMYAPFLTRYLKATGASDQAYYELLAQYSFILSKMRDENTGLYYHAYAGTGHEGDAWSGGKADQTSPNFWLRSMGWFITSLIDVIDLMPETVDFPSELSSRIPQNFSSANGNQIDTSSGRNFLISMYKDIVDGLLKFQDPNSKMFYQVIDKGPHALGEDGNIYKNYVETSGSSMIAYAVLKGSRLNLFGASSSTYSEYGQEIYEGIYNHSLHDNKLYDICRTATLDDGGQDGSVKYYLQYTDDTRVVMNDGKGSGPFVMAFIEYNAATNDLEVISPTTQNVSERKLHLSVNGEVQGFVVTENKTATNEAILAKVTVPNGYTIVGWYTDSSFNNAFVPGTTTISTDTTIYAKLEQATESYNVTFNSNGGSQISEQSTSGNSFTISEQMIPTRDGYNFSGWEYNGSTYTQGQTITGITGDIELNATWTAIQYTITYNNTKGAQNTNPTTYTIETETTNLVNLTLTGYEFDGWYDAEEGGNEVTSIAGGSMGDKELYARWTAIQYTINYELDGGTNNGDNPTKFTLESGTITLYNPSREGFAFGGWTSSDVTISNNSFAPVAKDVTVTATWTASGYTITYNNTKGAQNTNPTTYTVASETIDLVDLSLDGYEFDGWYDAQEGGNKVTSIASGSTGDKALYARWTAIEYNINYELDGGTNNGDNPEAFTLDNATVTLKAPTKDGFTFTGWTSNDVTISNNSFTPVAKDVTVTATWTETIITYTVTHNANSGSISGSATITGNANVTINLLSQSAVTRSGFTLLGWDENQNAKQPTYSAGEDYTLTKNVTLYAIWGKNITITYDFTSLTGDQNGAYNEYGNYTINGLKENQSGLDIDENHKYAVSTYAGADLLGQDSGNGIGVNRVNYRLIGWSRTLGSTTLVSSYDLTENVTLYPVWEISGDTQTPRTTSSGAIGDDRVTTSWNTYKFNNEKGYSAVDNQDVKNIRWTDFYANNVSNGIYTVSQNDFATINVDTTGTVTLNKKDVAVVSVDTEHRMVSEPIIKISKSDSSSNILKPISIVLPSTMSDYYATIKVYAVVFGYNKGTADISLWNGQTQVGETTNISSKYGNDIDFSKETIDGVDVYNVVNDFYNGGFTPDVMTVSQLEIGPNGSTYTIGNNNTGNVYITAIEVEFIKKDAFCQATFNANGGTFAQGKGGTLNVFKGEQITLPTANDISYAGYTLTGWSDGAQTYDVGATVTISGDAQYVAQWSKNTYTVTYNANGGSGDLPADATIQIGDTINVSTATLEKAGYVFGGWATTNNANSGIDTFTLSQSNINLVSSGKLTLYAVWKSTYTVTLNENGGTFGNGVTTTYTQLSGTTITLPTADDIYRDEYALLGWSESQTATSATYQPGAPYNVEKTVTLYAVWRSTNVPTESTNVYFYNGTYGPAVTGLTVTKTFTSTTQGNITIDGESVTGSIKVLQTGGKTAADRYFSIQVDPQYYTSFKVNIIAASNNSTATHFALTTTISEPTTSSDGYFLTSGTSSNAHKTGSSAVCSSKDGSGNMQTYYLNFSNAARFAKIEFVLYSANSAKYTVSYSAGENFSFTSAIDSVEVSANNNHTITSTIPETTTSGYVFSHWTYGGNRYVAGNSIRVSTNITLVASWDKVISAINFGETTYNVLETDASSSLGLAEYARVTYTGGSSSNLVAITWNLAGAKNSSSQTVDLSQTSNRTEGVYTIQGSVDKNNAPDGYAYSTSLADSAFTVSITLNIINDSTVVVAGVGYQNSGNGWSNGLTLDDNYYQIASQSQGGREIARVEANASVVGNIQQSNPLYGNIPLSYGSYSTNNTTSNISSSGIRFTIIDKYISVKISVKLAQNTSSLYLLDNNGAKLAESSASQGELVYTAIGSEGGNISTTNFYLFANGENVYIYNMVINVTYTATGEPETANIRYGTVSAANQEPNYTSIVDNANYLDGAMVALSGIGEFCPHHYSFNGWSYGGKTYSSGDVVTLSASQSPNDYIAQYTLDTPNKVTFNWNLPADITDIDIDEFTVIYVFDGDKISQAEAYTTDDGTSMTYNEFVSFMNSKFGNKVNGFYTISNGDTTYILEGWYNNTNVYDENSLIYDDLVINVTWQTDSNILITARDISITVPKGTASAQLGLPSSTQIDNRSGTSDVFENAFLGSWIQMGMYDANTTGQYLFRAQIISAVPDGATYLPTWANYSFDGNSYDRKEEGADSTTYYVFCLVTVDDSYTRNSYVAEFTAFSYTGSGDSVVYNNNSNSHDVAWTDYTENDVTVEGQYRKENETDDYDGIVVARNGNIKVIADTKTPSASDEDVPAAVVDVEYHGQTYSMIKGIKTTSNQKTPFMYVTVPEGAKSVKIHLYAVKFRSTGGNPELIINPDDSGATESGSLIVSKHSYTEVMNQSDFNYFYTFSPSYLCYEYSGDATKFEIINNSTSVNAYVTGIKVECVLSTNNESERHIVYHANNGTSQSRNVLHYDNVGTDDVIIEKNFFEKEGGEFQGWSTTSNGSVVYKPGESLDLSDLSTLNLYAVWKDSVNITYYSAGDGLNDSFVKYYPNGRGTIAYNEFDMSLSARKNLVFVSWNTKADGSGDTYLGGGIWNPNGSETEAGKIDGDKVLYAQWAEGSMFTSRFSAYSSTKDGSINTAYSNSSNTFGNVWTSHYSNASQIANNGGIVINASNATASLAGQLSSPMLKVANGSSITVSVPKTILSNSADSQIILSVDAVVGGSTPAIISFAREKREGTTTSNISYINPTTISRSISPALTSFTTFAAETAQYFDSINTNSIVSGDNYVITINVANADVYIVDISLSVSLAQSPNTLTYDSNSGADSTQEEVNLLTNSAVVDINHFERSGYTFDSWNTKADGTGDKYTYGQVISTESIPILYAQWTAKDITYIFMYKDTDGEWIEYQDASVTQGLGIPLSKPQNPVDSSFYGWFTDSTFYDAWNFSSAPSFDLATYNSDLERWEITFYGYVGKTTAGTALSIATLEDKTDLMLNILDNIQNIQNSTLPTTKVTAEALGLPSTVLVSSSNGAFSEELAIDWTSAMDGLVVATLPSGTSTFTGFIRLSDADYANYAFVDNNGSAVLQQTTVSINYTLNNIVIEFNNSTGNPLVQDKFNYSTAVTDRDIINNFVIEGFYSDRNSNYCTYSPTGLAWSCSPSFGSAVDGNYTFTTTLVADKGYEFQGGTWVGGQKLQNTLAVSASVTLTEPATGVAAVGFDKKNSSWIVDKTQDTYVIDSNGGLSTQLVLSGIRNQFGDNDGYLSVTAGYAGIRIDVPSDVNRLVVRFKAGLFDSTKTGSIALVTQGGAYNANNLVEAIDLASYVVGSNEYAGTFIYSGEAKTIYLASTQSTVYFSQIYIVTDATVSTSKENLSTVRFYNQGSSMYLKTGSGYTSTTDDAVKFVLSAKVPLPNYTDVTGLPSVNTDKVEFVGWTTTLNSDATIYPAGTLVDIDFAINNNATLYANFRNKTYSLTFEGGYGASDYVVYIPIGSTITSVIDITNNKPDELLALENGRIGYYFVRWVLNGETFTGNGITPTGDIVVNAEWSAKTYIVAFYNYDGDLIESKEVGYVSSFDAVNYGENPTPDNLTFRAWRVEGSNNDWNFRTDSLDSEKVISSTTTETVKFLPQFGVKVTFFTEYEGIEGSADPKVTDPNVYEVGTPYDVNVYSTGLAGYTFEGWALEADAPVEDKITAPITLTENISFYAIWSPKTYNVKFMSGDNVDGVELTGVSVDGSSLSGDNTNGYIQEVQYNEKIGTVTATNSQGYIVHSWYYYDNSGVERTWVFDGNNPNKIFAPSLGDTIVLYARWGVNVKFEKYESSNNSTQIDLSTWYGDTTVAIGSYIEFVGGDGRPSESSQVHQAPHIPSYEFVGWYTKNSFTDEYLINSTTLTIDSVNNGQFTYDASSATITLYAVFEEALGDITITFVNPDSSISNFVTMPDVVTVGKNEEYNLENAVVVYKNYGADFIALKGWTTVGGGNTNVEYELDDSVYFAENTYLFAVWEITINDVAEPVIDGAISRQDELPSLIDGIYDTANVDNYIAQNAISILWQLQMATPCDANGDATGEPTVDLTQGFISGTYLVTGNISINSGYKWADGAQKDTIDIVINIIGEHSNYYIVQISTIDATCEVGDDFRLDKVKVYIATSMTQDESQWIDYFLDVRWSSQIDTSIHGKHYVTGTVDASNFMYSGISLETSATVDVKLDEESNPYVYKTYQSSTLPSVTAPSGYEFLCWTDNGINVYNASATPSSAGKFTAIFAKLSLIKGASLRLNRGYTGLRFGAKLEFYGSSYVSELVYNKANPTGKISVSMSFSYGDDKTIGGSAFKNIVQEIDDNGNAVITFSGVISDIVTYDANGDLLSNSSCEIEFTPTAIVKVANGAGDVLGVELTQTGDTDEYIRSAKQTAQNALDSGSYSAYEDILIDYGAVK